MNFTQKYSGSSGNLYVLTTNSGKRLIIDPGVTWKKMQKALDYSIENVVGCLISHEHFNDHCKSAKDVIGAGIDVFASRGTLEALGLTDCRQARIIRNNSVISFGEEIKVKAFSTIHDAAEPLGFVIRADDEYLLFATDTAYIRQKFPFAFNIITIECSYDKEILQANLNNKEIDETVAKRLLSSHQEKSVALRYLKEFCDLSRCRELHLLHLSKTNIDKKQVKKEFEEKLFVKTIVI